MRTLELRQQRKKLIEDSRAILNKADADKRELTAEEQAEYDRHDADIEKLDARIEREEKLELREKSMNDLANDKRTTVENGDKKPTSGNDELRTKAFFKFLTEGRASLSNEEFRSLNATQPSKGGYIMAPETFVNEILKVADNLVFIRQKARKFTLPRGGTLGVPTLDARASVFTRGNETSMPSENDSITFGKRELKPTEFKSLFKVTEKLLEGGVINVDSLLREEIGYALGISEEQEFMTGSGAGGQALGLFTASSDGISTSRDVSTDNTTTAVTADNLIEVQESVKDFYQPRCEWIGSRALRKKVRKLKGSDGQYIWEESIKVGVPALLLGRPFTASEYCPSTFTAGLYVGLYGDLSNYWIADSVSLQIKELDELYAAEWKKGYRCLTEMDAMPVKEEAFARIQLAPS